MTWSGSPPSLSSFQPRISLHVEELVDGFRWLVTEAWKPGEYPADVPRRKRINVGGRSESMDAAKAAAEQMAAVILKRRRSWR